MPNLSDVRRIIASTPPVQDTLRRDYLKELHELVKRDVILYATYFSAPSPNVPASLININDQDVQHLMSVISELRKDGTSNSNKLDLILHSPGGSLAATEQIVGYLRKKYEYIRVIVPQNAMSAATMIACSADEVLLGHHSALGPTDPQVFTSSGGFAAQSVINEFNKAKQEVKKDMSALPLWASRLANWPPGLLDHCERAVELSEEIVADWLHKYMKLDEGDAKKAAEYLADANKHKIHDRRLNFGKLKSLKLKVSQLEDNQELQEKVLSVFHATTATFESSPCIKIVENHFGKGVYQILRQPVNAA